MTAHAIDATRINAGFADPVMDAQAVFRGVLAAMAEPGTIHDIDIALDAPTPLNPATSAICLALADFDTPVWLDRPAMAAADFLRFHCGCPITDEPADARFAIIADALPAPRRFAQGSDEYPDTSTTLVFQASALSTDGPLRLSGPGIADETRLGVDGLPPDFDAVWRENTALFPCGVDLIITSGRRVCCLPRATSLRI